MIWSSDQSRPMKRKAGAECLVERQAGVSCLASTRSEGGGASCYTPPLPGGTVLVGGGEEYTSKHILQVSFEFAAILRCCILWKKIHGYYLSK